MVARLNTVLPLHGDFFAVRLYSIGRLISARTGQKIIHCISVY